MTSRIVTPVTNKVSEAYSIMRAEVGNYPQSLTKFTVIHKRPISSTSSQSANSKPANTMCTFSTHPVLKSMKRKEPVPGPVNTGKRGKKIKRSLSADNIDNFEPMPAKRRFPVQIWFNKSQKVQPTVATAHWQDSPLHESSSFIFAKLLEASQAHRYLQLQSRPRKYLHLTGGWIHAINNPPTRKAETPIVSMKMKTNASKVQQIRKKPQLLSSLPPPPALISLQSDLHANIEQDKPLELCKRRKPCDVGDDPPKTEPDHRFLSPQDKPLNLAITNNIPKRKIALPPLGMSDSTQPLDLASPTVAFQNLNLFEKPVIYSDAFRQRLVLVLQVLLGPRNLNHFGHPQASIDDILARILRKADIVPAKNADVRENWIKFLSLCVKNEEAWKREGWDRKSPDTILEEIYVQDVIPILRKSEATPSTNNVFHGKREPGAT